MRGGVNRMFRHPWRWVSNQPDGRAASVCCRIDDEALAVVLVLGGDRLAVLVAASTVGDQGVDHRGTGDSLEEVGLGLELTRGEFGRHGQPRFGGDNQREEGKAILGPAVVT